MYVCVCLCVQALESVLTSEDNFQKWVLYFHNVGPRDGTQVIGLGSRYPYWLNHHTSPTLSISITLPDWSFVWFGFVFEIRCHSVVQAELKLIMKPKLASNFQSSCLSLLSDWIHKTCVSTPGPYRLFISLYFSRIFPYGRTSIGITESKPPVSPFPQAARH